MPKNGQARVLDDTQFAKLINKIQRHRHREKNTLIMQLSFKLALRVQEISLLCVKEVANLSPQYPLGFEIKEVLALPKCYTKGAAPVRRSVRFSLADFDQLVKTIARLARRGAKVNPEDYYPTVTKTGGRTRELPIVDPNLRRALTEYLALRLQSNPRLKKSDPLILSQKGGKYSPNTLQEHMATMLREWAGVERASSHSGRRSLATKLLHDHGEHLKTVQKILGHKDAATTVIYHEIPEAQLKKVLLKAGIKGEPDR